MENQNIQNPVSEPANNPVSVPLATMNRNPLVIIFSLLALVLLASTAFLYYQNQQLKSILASYQILITPSPAATPDVTANWKTYTITPDPATGYASYNIKLPAQWKQIEHSSSSQSTETFQDTQNIYRLIIDEQKNFNSQTGKPFTSLRELVGLPYDSIILTVDGEPAAMSLPREGPEHIYEVLFFSKDTTLFYSITLETPRDVSKTEELGILFTQILSTFKFTGTTQSQQVLGIQLTQCCSCPIMIDASQIGKDRWVTYEQGKDYTAQRPKACSLPNIGACAPCPPL